MYKILNYQELIKNIRRQDPLPPVYQEDFDEDFTFIEFPKIIDRGEPLRFTITKDEDNFYIEYNNPSAIHGAYDGCSYFTNMGGYHQTFKDNFDNYYSLDNEHKGLPLKLLKLISDDTLAIFFISNAENIDKDIKKLTDFLIKEGIVVAGDSLK